MMPIRKTTYQDYDKHGGESHLDLQQALNLFRSMTWKEGAFMYFEINDVNVLQILFHDDKRFLIEITNDGDDMIYLQKYANQQQVVDLLTYYFENSELALIGDFYQVPIITKTLDDVIKENN